MGKVACLGKADRIFTGGMVGPDPAGPSFESQTQWDRRSAITPKSEPPR